MLYTSNAFYSNHCNFDTISASYKSCYKYVYTPQPTRWGGGGGGGGGGIWDKHILYNDILSWQMHKGNIIVIYSAKYKSLIGQLNCARILVSSFA